MKKLYTERNTEKQGQRYISHLTAMTTEKLHSKADIAAELAYRDMVIDELFSTITSVANFLRGMSLDPSIPSHVKEAIIYRVQVLDSTAPLDDDDDD